MTIERTLVLIKPDGVQRGLSGEIISRFEKTGLKIIAIKLMSISEDKASQHYAEHAGKPFYNGLVEFITSSPVVAMAFEGTDAISLVRKQMGSTNPNEATPGSIRGDYATDIGRNLVHGSATSEDAERELKLFFSSEELLSYDRSYENWITE
jgi:nucleoside-diphosphate kinase